MKIAIYGLSNETEKAIDCLKTEYEIVGLLDGFKTNGTMYGLDILAIEKAIGLGVKKIVVVARPASCKVIAKRIGVVCRNNQIDLIDIHGKDLLCSNEIKYEFVNDNRYLKKDILLETNKVEVVSFDLFDTLVVRNCLYVTDIVGILTSKLNEEGWFDANIIDKDNFINNRIAAEKQLAMGGNAPSLTEIYNKFIGNVELASQLADREFSVDFDLIEFRQEMVELVAEIIRNGKKVFITSDTYYSEKQIRRVLNRNEILKDLELILSCDYKTSKSGKLYDRLKEKSGSEYILHIGDDQISDIEKASEHGIRTFKIASAFELLDSLGGLGLDEFTNSLSDRIRVGMFAAEIFNSPFQFEDGNKRVYIERSESIGSIICAPMVLDFMEWFIYQTDKRQFSNIWFGARDGYLFKQLYGILKTESKSEYLLISRIAAIRSGVCDKEDIEYVDSMKYSGSLKENLKNRFDIDIDLIESNGKTCDTDSLLNYSYDILKKAECERNNFFRYLENINYDSSDIAFFDFVAKGTTQLFLQKLLKNHIHGYYFLQLEAAQMKNKDVDVLSFYVEEERIGSAIYNNYYVLETILTAPEPSVHGFDECGKPIYAKETRSQDNIKCIMKVQSGIKKYVKKYISLCPKSEREINKKLDEAFLLLISKLDIRDEAFLNLVIEDPFFNRMTDIKDVI